MKTLCFLLLALTTSIVRAESPTFHCVGTEPFWSINVAERAGWLRFSSPTERMSLRILNRRVAQGSSRYGAFMLETRWTTLTVIPARCNDGMSDSVYTHAAMFDMGGRRIHYGCCDVSPALDELW
jgi:uncharacterized membrane protein